MNTAVQLRPIAERDRPRCDLVCGHPDGLVDGKLGRIALFGPGVIVAYRLRHLRCSRLYVFRTLAVAKPQAARVPGVRPQVVLLLDLRSTGRVRLARKLFAYLAQAGRNPSALSDAFYARVGAAMGGRLPRHKLLLRLLNRELPPVPGPRGAPVSAAG